MIQQYTDDELSRLHDTLYEILAEVVRVCDKLGIRYLIIGGTGIGAFFWDRILPWDDDIDIGMTRDNYERFLAEAPAELGERYFLQWFKTDERVPFFFAKVRKNGTLFTEGLVKDIPMHHGIYVDIFPFDNIPENRMLEKLQYNAMGFLNACFIAKEIWQWRWCGRCSLPEPHPRGFIPCLITRIINTLLPKRAIFRLLTMVQTMFNGRPTRYCKNIVTPSERVLRDHVDHPRMVTLGPLTVAAPYDLEAYLHDHYPVLEKNIPKEQQVNHRPDRLEFG